MSNFYIIEDLQLILSRIICLKEMRGLPLLRVEGRPTTVLKWVVDFVSMYTPQQAPGHSLCRLYIITSEGKLRVRAEELDQKHICSWVTSYIPWYVSRFTIATISA